ncbi:hypothetical protein ADUPG1_008543 [Aduncisulcus paluster]|uniref:Reverse transcriptase domain-containing protein n=1 Tax=Aduncisulcus paluster TaxID=2918883 RepID=A0ABQ5KSC7_9EUKA|nr:hypothetical protein ADUPG1_008543 [Aduncisulcus paluster]
MVASILPEFGLELNCDKTIYVPLAPGALPATTEEDDFVVERCHDVMGVSISSDEEIASQAALKIEIPSTRLALPLEKGGLRCHMPLYDRDTLKLRSLKHLARDVRGVFPSGIGAFLKNLQASDPSKHFMDLLHTAAWVEFLLSDPGFVDTSQEMEHDETRDENEDENEVQSPATSGEQSEIMTGPPGLDVENDVSSSGQDSHHSSPPDPPGEGTSTIVRDSHIETVSGDRLKRRSWSGTETERPDFSFMEDGGQRFESTIGKLRELQHEWLQKETVRLINESDLPARDKASAINTIPQAGTKFHPICHYLKRNPTRIFKLSNLHFRALIKSFTGTGLSYISLDTCPHCHAKNPSARHGEVCTGAAKGAWIRWHNYVVKALAEFMDTVGGLETFIETKPSLDPDKVYKRPDILAVDLGKNSDLIQTVFDVQITANSRLIDKARNPSTDLTYHKSDTQRYRVTDISEDKKLKDYKNYRDQISDTSSLVPASAIQVGDLPDRAQDTPGSCDAPIVPDSSIGGNGSGLDTSSPMEPSHNPNSDEDSGGGPDPGQPTLTEREAENRQRVGSPSASQDSQGSNHNGSSRKRPVVHVDLRSLIGKRFNIIPFVLSSSGVMGRRAASFLGKFIFDYGKKSVRVFVPNGAQVLFMSHLSRLLMRLAMAIAGRGAECDLSVITRHNNVNGFSRFRERDKWAI